MRILPRKWPLLPTLVIALAVAGMIGLGAWQLRRAEQKEMLFAEILHNPGKPATVFPRFGPVAAEMMFRRSTVNCLGVESWTVEAGRAEGGSSGFRYIAHCRTGAEGPGALVAVGVGVRPDMKPGWDGGPVTGWITREPDHRSLFAHLTGPDIVLRPMLVAEKAPIPAFKASAPPSIDNIPNNHRAYAVQWFLFAAIALIIYILALIRRETAAHPDS